jgi:hypothetical protein
MAGVFEPGASLLAGRLFLAMPTTAEAGRTGGHPMFIVVPLLVAIVLACLIPFMAWRGRPHGFRRLQWIGVAIGSGIIGAIVIVLMGIVASWHYETPGEHDDLIYVSLFSCAAITVAVALGSIIALFFCRPGGSTE